MRHYSRIKALALGLGFMAATALLAGCMRADGGAATDAAPSPAIVSPTATALAFASGTGETLQPRVVLRDWGWSVSPEGERVVTGSIENLSASPVTGDVAFRLYDESGRAAGEARGLVYEVQPNSTRKFGAYAIAGARVAEFAGLRADGPAPVVELVDEAGGQKGALTLQTWGPGSDDAGHDAIAGYAVNESGHRLANVRVVFRLFDSTGTVTEASDTLGTMEPGDVRQFAVTVEGMSGSLAELALLSGDVVR